MPITDTTTPFLTQAAAEAGMTVLEAGSGADPQGKPTYLYQFSFADAASEARTLPIELSESFQISAPEMQEGLKSYLADAAKRLRNPRPDAYVTLAGLPISVRDFKWPLHRSTSGADTFLIHGSVFLDDGVNASAPAPLHARISAAVTVTFAEIVVAPEQPYAESFVFNAIRKTLDQGQLEFVKSGNRQPVPVTTRYYSRWQKKFIFADTTAEQRREFVAMKAFWLSGVLGGKRPVWMLDPCDAQYLNTTVEELRSEMEKQAAAGLIQLEADGEFASATSKVMEHGERFRQKLQDALAATKPVFNEAMRSGQTNM